MKRLRDWRERVSTPRSMAAWRDSLADLALDFLDPGDDEGGLQRLFESVDDLTRLAAENKFDLPVPFSIAAREIEREVDEVVGSNPFRVGGVTFCDLSSLRSLPYRVIALLGMNDGAFPRRDRSVRFDLMSHRPAIGDRTPRLEDRHLFLEALLSARDRLIITFQGQGIRDQKPRPPSVLVEELLGLLEHSDNGATSLRADVLVQHPLQVFSPRYFDGQHSQLFSYEAGALRAAESLVQDKRPRPVFADQFLEPVAAADQSRELTKDDLRLVLTAPWKLFLQRLRISTGVADSENKEREPLLLDHLEEWHIGDQWLRERMQGIDIDTLTRRFTRSGLLPAGPLGAANVKRFVATTEQLVERARSAGFPQQPEADPTAARKLRYSNLSTRYVLDLWFDHLQLTDHADQQRGRAVLIARNGMFAFEPIEPDVAQAELEKLRALAELAQRMPLPFFADCIEHTWVRATTDFENEEAVSKLLYFARTHFIEEFRGRGPGLKPDVQAAFAGFEPLDLRCSECEPFAKFGDRLLFLHLTEQLLETPAKYAMPSVMTASSSN